MQRVIDLIQSQMDRHPGCVYYLEIIDKAQLTLLDNPNICVEFCKSLLEGISKTVLAKTRPDLTADQIDRMKYEPLLTNAMIDLRENDDIMEDQFKTKVVEFGHWLGLLRNHRGELSHGRGVPKLKQTTDKLALLCLHTTEAIAFYMLDAFYNLKAATDTDPAGEADEHEEQDLPRVAYDANSEFNDELDGRYPLDGKLLYSDALYRLYYEEYLIELAAYIDVQEDEGDGDGDAD